MVLSFVKQAHQIFLDYGFSEEASFGIAGNIHRETGGTWDPTIVESGGGDGYGLAQWTPRENLYQQANQLGFSRSEADTFDVQCKIIAQGDVVGQWTNNSSSQYNIPLNESPMTFNEYKRLTNVAKATVNFMTHYERPTYDPDGNAWRYRVEMAEQFASQIDGGVGVKPCFPTEEDQAIESSPYGWRIHPIHGDLRFHTGQDWSSGSQHLDIYATQSGKVITSHFSESGGWMVEIEHTGDSYFSRYLHMKEKPLVNVGDTVQRCEKIGIMGTTGSSTGIHLHFEVGTSAGGLGTQNGTIDPLDYLDMEFGGSDPSDPIKDDLIMLWLSDALNGWKW